MFESSTSNLFRSKIIGGSYPKLLVMSPVYFPVGLTRLSGQLIGWRIIQIEHSLFQALTTPMLKAQLETKIAYTPFSKKLIRIVQSCLPAAWGLREKVKKTAIAVGRSASLHLEYLLQHSKVQDRPS